MEARRHRFVHVACVGAAAAIVASTFIACESDPDSSVDTTPDAAPFELVDAAKDGPSWQDATVDAAPDASSEQDATGDANTDADQPFVAVHADVTTDFATTANPNGAWTYGYSLGQPAGGDAGAIVVFGAVSSDTPDMPAWYDPQNAVLGTPSAWRNDSTASKNGIAPGEFAMHPGNAGEYAIARWTAPVAGVYAITVQFKAGDTGDTNGLLLHNGVALVTEDSTSTDAVHDLDVTLAVGDHLDVAVGSKGDFLFDSTPVRLTIRNDGSAP